MDGGINDFVGGVLLAWAFAHLVAATIQPKEDWARVRAAPRRIFITAVLSVAVALRVTSDNALVLWLVDRGWMVSVASLLLVPVVAGSMAQRRLSRIYSRATLTRTCFKPPSDNG